MDYDVKRWDPWVAARATDRNIEAVLRAVRNGEVNSIHLDRSLGFKGKDIHFLGEVADCLMGLFLTTAESHNLRIIEGLKQLRLLHLSETASPPDLSGLRKLTHLDLTWTPKLVLPCDSPLERLALSKYKPSSGSLDDLPAFDSLKELVLVYGNLVDLSGIQKYRNLRKAQFARLKNLSNVAALAQTGVEELEFTACPRFPGIQWLAQCERLKWLKLDKCPRILTLRVLDSFRSLRKFSFIGTDVQDGDMTPLFRLEYAGFLRKRGFSHTPEEVAAHQVGSAGKN